jgi:hypothetical protein
LVFRQKWLFSAIAASICWIACAAYDLYASAQSLDFLDLAKNCSFLNWKLELLPIVADFDFWLGSSWMKKVSGLFGYFGCAPNAQYIAYIPLSLHVKSLLPKHAKGLVKKLQAFAFRVAE